MESEIREIASLLVSAVARGDARAASEVYADDGKLVSPSAELIDGRREIQAYWQPGIALGLTRLELQSLHVDTAQESAVELGRYTVSLRAGQGELVTEQGSYLTVYRRQRDGVCRRAVDVFDTNVLGRALAHRATMPGGEPIGVDQRGRAATKEVGG